MRSKYTAALLAIFLGAWGLHRFYLKERRLGIRYFVASTLLLFISIQVGAPIIAIMVAVAIIDALVFLFMPQSEFDAQYNYNFSYATSPVVPSGSQEIFKKMGITFFRERDYRSAVQNFEHALELQPHDPYLHFNLACAYAQLGNIAAALQHLSRAVENGFQRYDLIDDHWALNSVRNSPDYRRFVQNGYQHYPSLEPPKVTQWLDASPPDLIQQLTKLGELQEKGLLTREEFDRQKQRLLQQTQARPS